MGRRGGAAGCRAGGLQPVQAGIVITSLGREQWGEPGSPTPRARCWGSFLFPQACSFVCVCIGGSGEFFCLLWFPFFFLVCPLDSPWLGCVCVCGGTVMGNSLEERE